MALQSHSYLQTLQIRSWLSFVRKLRPKLFHIIDCRDYKFRNVSHDNAVGNATDDDEEKTDLQKEFTSLLA
jgi:hypothetical protein